MRSSTHNAFDNPTAYNGYVGRWSRLIAGPFVNWLRIPSGRMWLDVGAGTGVLTQVILHKAAPSKILGVDLSESYIERAKQDVRDPRAVFKVVDVSRVAAESPEFDVGVAGLVLNFVPSPPDTLLNIKRSVKSGGTVALYVWDYADRMEIMRQFWDAAIRLDPAAAAMDSGKQFPICHPDALRSLFEAAALKAVEVIPIEIQAHFRDFDDYWLPFLGAQGSVSKYLLSLDEEGRHALTVQLRSQLPTNPDGSIDLAARAWAIKGIR